MLRSAFLFCSFLLAISCSEKKKDKSSTVSTQLLRIGSTHSESSLQALSNEWTSLDVFIDSYKLTISDIAISPGTQLTGSNSSVVYNCPGNTSEACLINVAQSGAVQNLLTSGNSGSVQSGVYTFATVGTCKASQSDPEPNGSYVYIKARVKYNGTWWYTQSDGAMVDSGIADSDPWVAPIDYDEARRFSQGCRTYNVFQNPISIGENASVNLKLFFELRNLVSLVKGNKAGALMCYGADPSDQFDANSFYICDTYLYLAGTIESETPDLHRYKVLSSSGGYDSVNIFGIYFRKGTKTPAGAYNYPYLDADVDQVSSFSQVIKSISSHSSGKLNIVTYGGQTSTDEIDSLPGSFNTTDFPILDNTLDSTNFTWAESDSTARTATAIRME